MFTLVTGVGYTGRRVLALLPRESAIGLSRSTLDIDRPTIALDLDSATTLPVALPSQYAVIYTVPPKGDAPDARLQRLLSILEPTPQRFVYISTTGVYGDCAGATVSEATPVKPANERSGRRVAAETLLAEWAGKTACDLVILRAPGIYGPGRLGLDNIRSRMPVLTEDDTNPGNRIHVDDLAACCVAALAKSTPAGIYNVGDNDHRSSTWFTGEVARQAGLPVPPQISREAANDQFSPARLSFMAESRRVDTRKMRELLGVTPRYTNPEDGIASSLEYERPVAATDRG